MIFVASWNSRNEISEQGMCQRTGLSAASAKPFSGNSDMSEQKFEHIVDAHKTGSYTLTAGVVTAPSGEALALTFND